ncbi:hypothetical protein GCM10012275_64110 [Longimycelium tulufanense]|uniref:Aminoglycoside phosphotransferase domain-containing protein n=1 Tax=Longimycelium tulufanense TaxID=907463 RepID=A0A8J3CLD6_9PSEU|nr:aminoglycoside phosphotransferase family protein [Longimycelium tulufanense]GGM84581.1 hypothetical protein GCM10012275_64110 [Longimycelium tulufanense]
MRDVTNSKQFSAQSSLNVLRAACDLVGLSDKHAELMRLGENALYNLPDFHVVVRIARTMDYWADAENEVAVARWLASHGFPAADVADFPQPIEVDGHPVTFWRFIPGREGDREDIATLGTVLRRLHSTPLPTDFRLPAEDILGRVAPRIKTAPVSTADRDFLLVRLAELSSALTHLSYPLHPAPTHGDAHTGNLMICEGQPILIDFERVAWGQPEWDLAVSATEYQTAGWLTEEEYRDFVDAYGYDVTTWTEGFDTLRAVHELKMTTWLMQNVNESPDIAEEYQVRMRTIRGDRSSGWRPF